MLTSYSLGLAHYCLKDENKNKKRLIMASYVATPSPSTPTLPIYPGWPLKEITQPSVQELFAKKFSEFVGEYSERSLAKHLSDLDRGPWYPNDYADACLKFKQHKRLDFMIRQNAWIDGYPPKGFSKIPDDKDTLTGYQLRTFQLNPEILPTEGLNSLLYGRCSIIDCELAFEISIYLTIHEIFGSTLFNQLFTKDPKHPLRMGKINNSVQQLQIVYYPSFNPKSPQLEIGDRAYFPNIPHYLWKNPLGEHGGYHGVCISKGDVPHQAKRFAAFGIDPKGVTSDQFIEIFLSNFKKTPLDPSTRLPSDTLSRYLEEIKNSDTDVPEAEKKEQIHLLESIDEDTQKDFMTIQIRGQNGWSQLFRPDVLRLNAKKIRRIAWHLFKQSATKTHLTQND